MPPALPLIPPPDPASDIPKSRRIADALIEAIREGRLRVGERLPSINALSRRHGLSRDTVIKAYGSLEADGVIRARHGNGFYVAADHVCRKLRVLVLFDTFTNGFKNLAYAGLIAGAGDVAEFDFYSHNFNDAMFRTTLERNSHRYDRLVVMPYASPAVREVLSSLPQYKLLLLDIPSDFPGKACGVIAQSHDEQTEAALLSAQDRLRRYGRLRVVLPPAPGNPVSIAEAGRRVAARLGLGFDCIPRVAPDDVAPGDLFLVIDDADLVALIKAVRARGWTAGREVGVISYNDTPLKEVLEGGVTTISIDFQDLGLRAARRIREWTAEVETVPTRLILRHTL